MTMDLIDHTPRLEFRPRWAADSETGILTDVLLCPPAHLFPVPCCSVTRSSLRQGFSTSIPRALAQHRLLELALSQNGVRVTRTSPHHDLPDMCFTRDSAIMTPWGLLGLRLAAPHRQDETEHLLADLRGRGIPVVGQVTAGTVEGGDIAIIRPGQVVIGCSGERTNEQGAEEVADVLRGRGWDVLIYRYDPHFLHLDTLLCMLAPGVALACLDVLDDWLIDALRAEGVRLLPVTYKESRRLGCNVLSLGAGRILSSDANERVNRMLSSEGFTVTPLELDEFTQCGGGVHCLTLPLGREAARSAWR